MKRQSSCHSRPTPSTRGSSTRETVVLTSTPSHRPRLTSTSARAGPSPNCWSARTQPPTQTSSGPQSLSEAAPSTSQRSLLRPGPSNESFLATINERPGEVLDHSECRTSAHGSTISIRGPTGALFSMPGFRMRLPSRPRTAAASNAERVSTPSPGSAATSGAPWPAPDEVRGAVVAHAVRAWLENHLRRRAKPRLARPRLDRVLFETSPTATPDPPTMEDGAS
jgi:hypothetical protein